jgi:hypothetical protein
MKKVISFTITLSLSLSLIAQQPVLPDIYLMTKSKNQKTAAYITLGSGAATFFTGFIILAQTDPGWARVNWDNVLGGLGLIAFGAGCTTASIILFSASKRNERVAHTMKVSINKPIQVNTGAFVKNLPYTVGISIPIR